MLQYVDRNRPTGAYKRGIIRVDTRYRQLPAVETLLQAVAQRLNGDAPAHSLLVAAVRATLAEARQAIACGEQALASADLADDVLARIGAFTRPSLRPVINATGVIIQTNLGRAPLSTAALAAMQRIGVGYSNLEYDLEAGARGTRSTHLDALLCQLTGAEAALVVNNNAAAVYLALITLAAGKEVIVSRGQAVEIGGGFRIPDVLRQSGATLVEIGTTNRTYARDYTAAISERTALLMRIHTSNFRLVGFVHETSLADMVEVAQRHGLRVLDDLGSGTLLDTTPYGLAPEPTVQQSISAGADLVAFSGDKLLGGPQAGLLVGRRSLIDTLKSHPLARALRVDKTTIAGLEATLQAYVRGRATEEIPVWRMIATPLDSLQQRAARLAGRIAAQIVPSTSAVGGGALPGETLPSIALALPGTQPDALAQRLRTAEPAIVGRIHEGRLLLDLRTVLEEQDAALLTGIQHVMRIV